MGHDVQKTIGEPIMHKFRRPDSERISMDELSKIYELKDGYLSRKHAGIFCAADSLRRVSGAER